MESRRPQPHSLGSTLFSSRDPGAMPLEKRRGYGHVARGDRERAGVAGRLRVRVMVSTVYSLRPGHTTQFACPLMLGGLPEERNSARPAG